MNTSKHRVMSGAADIRQPRTYMIVTSLVFGGHGTASPANIDPKAKGMGLPCFSWCHKSVSRSPQPWPVCRIDCSRQSPALRQRPHNRPRPRISVGPRQ
ncbi:hypothetical protein VFPFJ_01676 [Purpureocillium lilacinum]|uniref:Uncharacterized protein n=1 Tax=Purpureocillium lilacinum TaxID=33203 RepID=A0A179HYF2_PURLI|nr:hypothetical protein VFPFJ_01676 [Purpureocillium lilacinum]OAQ95566.1 hypothetical protein VFPFJ_01676 [Purpureocillium lilacinum]